MASKRLMRKKLALFMAMRDKPYFCEVEYLESTGTQWLDNVYSESASTQKLRVVCKAINTANLDIFGNVGNTTAYANGTKIVGINISSNAFLYYKPTGTRILLTLADTLSVPVILDATWNKADSTMSISNGITSDSDTYSGLNSGNVYKMFWRGATNVNPSKGKLYFLKIYDNDVLVRDFIPVLDWNMRPAMYDKVSRQMFYNQGTGEFVVGRQIHPLEYIESTGSQEILTGITGEARWVGTAQSTARSARSQIIIGASSGTAKFLASQIGSSGTVWGLSSYSGAYTTVGTTEKTTFDVSFTNSLTTATINNQYISYSATTAFEQEFGVFNRGNNYYFIGKLWGLNGYQNNNVVREFLPATDENGVGFLFDKVTHSIYDNGGTGEFVYEIGRGYKKLSYLQGTGTQYIDTGVVGTENTGAEIMIEVSDINTKIFGARGGTSDNNISVFYGSSADPRLGIDFNNSDYSLYRCRYSGLNTKLIVSLSKTYRAIKNASGEVLSYNDRLCSDTITTPYTLRLFDIANGFQNSMFIGKVYYCKIFDNGILKNALIPVLRISDSKPGMYDIITGQFFTNAGTGEFTYA